MTHQQANMATNTNFIISWFSSLCRCFSSMPDIAESMSPHQLYELHRKSSLNCSWFVQSNEALQRQSTVQALQQQQQQQAIQQQAIQQQQTEEAFRLTSEAFTIPAFECRRCPASFASNTKLHQHIRDRHAKRPKTSTTPISTSSATPPNTPIMRPLKMPSAAPLPSPPKPSAASPPWKAIADTIRTSPPLHYSCLANHVTRPTSTSKPSAASPPWKAIADTIHTPPPTPCLANHVTRPTFTPKPFATSTPYLTVEDLYSMFHQKPRSSSRSAMATHLSSASPFGMPSRQTRITSYFKPIGYSTPPPPRKTSPMRKYANSRFERESTWISHSAVASLFTNSLTSLSSSWPHRPPTLGRKSCMRGPQYCCLHRMM